MFCISSRENLSASLLAVCSCRTFLLFVVNTTTTGEAILCFLRAARVVKKSSPEIFHRHGHSKG